MDEPIKRDAFGIMDNPRRVRIHELNRWRGSGPQFGEGGQLSMTLSSPAELVAANHIGDAP